MNKKWTFLLALLLVLLSVGTAGAAEGGGMISAYTADVAALGGGVVGVEFDVSARTRVNAIGAQISIYAGAAPLETYRFVEWSAYVCGQTHCLNLIPGSQYYIEVTVFTFDYSGQEDRRTEGFCVTA